MATDRTDGWSVVLPLKRGALAKSRLAPYAGPHRLDLVRAMAVDTVRAVLASDEVEEAIVVTADADAAAELADVGVRIVDDRPDNGLNSALIHGAGHASGAMPRRAALNADLPALRAEDLSAALAVARSHPSAYVPDHDGTGTTLYSAGAGAAFTPCYGPNSAALHRRSGAIELDGAPSLRYDVDTESDLDAALRLGVGERTLAVVGLLDARPPV